MFADRIEEKWIDAFRAMLQACAVQPGEVCVILSETQSRALNVQLSERALHSLGARAYHLVLPTPTNPCPVPIRSTGASIAIGGLAPVVTALATAGLVVGLTGANAVGVWGWAAKPGMLAHWPGGLVVAFPRAGTVNGTAVLAPGDLNLTFKRYIAAPIRLTLVADRVVAIDGKGTDAAMMRGYLAAWGDADAYATSHVGWGLNPAARYEAMAMYRHRDTNGTELRAVAGNFLFSTGANEFAGRHRARHFDLPVMGTTITLNGIAWVRDGYRASLCSRGLGPVGPSGSRAAPLP